MRWTYETAMADALAKHPDCTHADWTPGLDGWYRSTIVVKLWRNEECWIAGDPPRHTVEGYLSGSDLGFTGIPRTGNDFEGL